MASDVQDTISTWRAFTVWMNPEKSAEMNAILDAAEAAQKARDAALEEAADAVDAMAESPGFYKAERRGVLAASRVIRALRGAA